jgi:hypothetical protein
LLDSTNVIMELLYLRYSITPVNKVYYQVGSWVRSIVALNDDPLTPKAVAGQGNIRWKILKILIICDT